MRTIALSLILILLVPLAVVKPWTGALTWTWISLMNPHTLTYGFLQNFPVALVVAAATVLGAVLSRQPHKLPLTPVTWTLLAFIAWMCITSAFAVHPDQIGEMFSKVMKIQFMLFVTLLLLRTRRHVELFVWVIVGSLAFFGIKGGIYTITTQGQGMVFGPEGTMIGGNNELALALTMLIPLMFYLRSMATRTWIRLGWIAAIGLTALCILGSQSRGALLAIVAMGAYLWRHSEKKIRFGIALAVAGVALIGFMPSKWEDRMNTIATYEQDNSAMGRINAWWMAYNLASDRFLGGGFEVSTPDLFAKYAPDPRVPRAAHSIYFQVLGEHGFVGLALFLLFWALTWRTAAWVAKNGLLREDTRSSARLATMVQVSLVGYFVGGAFLSLAYFDFAYDLMVIVVLLKVIVSEMLKAGSPGTESVQSQTRAATEMTPSQASSRAELRRLGPSEGRS